jgi:hypothetical protein
MRPFLITATVIASAAMASLPAQAKQVPSGETYTIRDARGGVRSYGPGAALPAGAFKNITCGSLPYNPSKPVKGLKCFQLTR